MTTLAEVRDGLAQAIQTGTGLRMSAYRLDNVNVPCGFVTSGEYDPHMVFADTKAVYPFTITVHVGRVAEVAGQKKLDELREPVGGVAEAAEDLDNWPVTVDYVRVTSVGANNGETRVADDVYLTCEFEIEVCF